MKIVTIFKWSRNPIDAIVRADGSVDWPGVKLCANDDDPVVMEIARALADGGEIVALTIGDGDAAWAAARGASRTVVVTDALTEADNSVTGAVLTAAVRHIGDADVVIIGDSPWEFGVVSALAGMLKWPAVAGVVSVEPGQGCLLVRRRMGTLEQVLEVKGPVVLAAAANRAEENAPGMKEVLKARKLPVEKITVADLGLEAVAQACSRGTKFPDTPPARVIDGADPAVACAELIAALRSDGVV